MSLHPHSLFRRGCITVAALSSTLVWAQSPVSVTFRGQTFTNQGLVGVGRMPSNLKDKFGETFGSFSAFMFDARSLKNVNGTFTGTLYAQPDRGYNAVGTTDYISRFNVLSVSFTPAPAGASTQNQVRLTLTDTIQYKEANGTPLTSLDPTSAGTGTRAGFPAMPQAFNGKLSLDPEGIVRMNDGSLFVSDEYGPYIFRFSSNGTLLSAIRPPEALIPKRNGADSFASNNPGPGQPTPSPADPTTGRQNNQGLEGLTVSPDGKKLFALLQSATRQDGGTGGTAATRHNTRLLAYDITSATPSLAGEYVVQLPTFLQGTATRVAAQSEMLALNNTQFLVLARDGGGRGTATPTSLFRSIFLYDIAGATNIAGTSFDTAATPIAPGGNLATSIVPAQRAELININDSAQLAKFGLHNGPTDDANNLSEKWEGLALVPALDKNAPNDVYLFVGNDNDFLTTDGFQAGAAYSAAVDNDTLVLVYRLTLPTYVDPLAYESARLSGAALAQSLPSYSLGVARLGTRDIGGHLTALRAGRKAEGGFTAFATGDWAELDGGQKSGSGEYDADGWAAAAGVEYGVGGLTLGIAGHRSDGSADLPGNVASISTEGRGFSGFLSYNLARVYVEGSATRSDFEHEFTRDALFYGLRADGKADGEGRAYHAAMGVRWPAAGLNVVTETGYDWVKARTDAFTETGAAHLNLEMPAISAESRIWYGAVQVAREFDLGGFRLIPHVRARFNYENGDEGTPLTFALAGKSAVSGASVATSSARIDGHYWRGAAGVSALVGSHCSLSAEIELALNSDYGRGRNILVSLRCAF